MHQGTPRTPKAFRKLRSRIISIPSPYITERVAQATELIGSIAGITASALPKDQATQKFLYLLQDADLDELDKIKTIFNTATEWLRFRVRQPGYPKDERDQAENILSLATNIESAIGAKRGKPQQINGSETVLSKR